MGLTRREDLMAGLANEQLAQARAALDRYIGTVDWSEKLWIVETVV